MWKIRNLSYGRRKELGFACRRKCKINLPDKQQSKTARKTAKHKTTLLERTLKENPVPVQFHFVCESGRWRDLETEGAIESVFLSVYKEESFGASLTYCQQYFFPPPNMDQQFGKRAIKRKSRQRGFIALLIVPPARWLSRPS